MQDGHLDRSLFGIQHGDSSSQRVWKEKKMTSDKDKSFSRNCGYFLSDDALGSNKIRWCVASKEDHKS